MDAIFVLVIGRANCTGNNLHMHMHMHSPKKQAMRVCSPNTNAASYISEIWVWKNNQTLAI